jgi:hypothetical protein
VKQTTPFNWEALASDGDWVEAGVGSSMGPILIIVYYNCKGASFQLFTARPLLQALWPERSHFLLKSTLRSYA